MLGLGFMYQQVTSIARANQAIKNLSIRRSSDDLASEKPDETILIANAISAFCASLDEEDVSSFASIVRRESEKYGYDWELILAIIKAESSLNARATSHKGAIGLMQVMPSTAEWLSPRLGLKYNGHSSLYDPVYNVKLVLIIFICFIKNMAI
jgi:soluble lytic murein transglycosylase-like protein